MRHHFSAIWSNQLKQAIIDECPLNGYHMTLAHEEANCVIEAVNQGIDSHLEACYIPDRGDVYTSLNKLICKVSPESLAVLIRRLMSSDNEQSLQLASTICSTLDIEII